jgi:hypothetical protein
MDRFGICPDAEFGDQDGELGVDNLFSIALHSHEFGIRT